jgi:hypothetical protein
MLLQLFPLVASVICLRGFLPAVGRTSGSPRPITAS